MVKTQRTFYEVRSWRHEVVGKRIARIHFAFQKAAKLSAENPGSPFYVTQSLGRFVDGVYTPW